MMLINSIKEHGLYEQSSVIRLGILNNSGRIDNDEILNDPKFEIVHVGKPVEYERATLHHMRKMAEIDDSDTLYYYLHTKGLRHFGTPTEMNVIDWIQLMLFWNIEKWELAVEKLKEHDTYGCNSCGNHYSGNFWWARSSHILKLPKHISESYNAPENWIMNVLDKNYSVYNSGHQGHGHYNVRFPREKYVNCTPL